MNQETNRTEITRLRELIPTLRGHLHGCTFASQEEAFKTLEDLKVRLAWMLGHKPDETTPPRRRRARGVKATNPAARR